MNCDTARRLIEANDPGLAGHMLSCPSCIVSAHATYYQAPAGLQEKISGALRRETAPAWSWRWVAIAASILLVASVTWNIVLLSSRADPQSLLAASVVSAHIRSLAGTHLLDVPSTDQHTVKPWFNGKLDFAPTVKEIDGFPLLGGRLEYFEGHSAAAMIYGRRQHIINLFTWPSQKQTPDASFTSKGFHVEVWSANGMAYWAVSDLNEADLRQFESLYRREGS